MRPPCAVVGETDGPILGVYLYMEATASKHTPTTVIVLYMCEVIH